MKAIINKGVNMEEAKRVNRRLILSYLVKNGPVSRKEIAASLGLTTAALTLITNSLISQGLVYEVGELTEGKVGRKQILIDIKAGELVAFGIELKSNKFNFTVSDIKSNLIYNEVVALNSTKLELIIEEIVNYVNKEKIKFVDKILGLGILVPGKITRNNGEVSLNNFIETKLKEKLSLDVIVENNIHGLISAKLFKERHLNDFWLIKYGPGVGSAIVLDNKVIKGANNKAGEIGHAPLGEGNNHCDKCGKTGCLESEIHFEEVIKRICMDSSLIIEKSRKEFKSTFKYLEYLNKLDNNKEIKKCISYLAKMVMYGYQILDSKAIILAGEIFKNNELLLYFKEEIVRLDNTINTDNISVLEDYEELKLLAAGTLVVNKYIN